MQVETYEVLTIDVAADGSVFNEVVSEEAIALHEALGLAGQKNLLAERTAGDGETTVVRVPYRHITLEEARVFGALFPTKVAIEKYDRCPIPLRVLQVAAHARDVIDGVKLVVWCPRSVQDQDPVLVGMVGYQTTFLLARWGEALEPLDVLKAKAQERLERSIAAEVAKLRGRLTLLEGALPQAVASWLDGEGNQHSTPWIGFTSIHPE